MSNPFKKVSPGDPFGFPAALYNATIDAALAHQRSERKLPPGLPAKTSANPAVVAVENDTGAALDQFSVLGFSSVTFGETDRATEFQQRNPVLVGRAPIADDADRFGVSVECAASGGVVPVVVAGVVQVLLDVVDPDHQFAALVDGETGFLETSEDPTGTPILWKSSSPSEEGGDLYWAVVRLGNPVGLPVGQYQGMVYQVVANNVNGFDFVVGHPGVS